MLDTQTLTVRELGLTKILENLFIGTIGTQRMDFLQIGIPMQIVRLLGNYQRQHFLMELVTENSILFAT